MASVGIIANPASGKDIRRLVSYATTISNMEKVNICKRIILAAQELGVDRFVFMPDNFYIGSSAAESLESDGMLRAEVEILDFRRDDSQKDTSRTAAEMEKLGLGCVIVLGGDGTSRAAAKGLDRTPLLPLSTGTNNVYPAMLEGTVAGMAAAAMCRAENPYECCIRDKRIEVFINGKFRDIALIDAVLTDDFFSGAKAVWDSEKISLVVVTRCHPASIGFSSLAGVCGIIRDSDSFGGVVHLGTGDRLVAAPIAAGVMAQVRVSELEKLGIGQDYCFTADKKYMIALDGEREVRVLPGDNVRLRISGNGPWRVLPREALALAQRTGMFIR